jgi:hypothetical protein
LFPAAVAWHPGTSLEPALPGILIRKDEGARGKVTGPGAMAAGTAGAQPAGRRAGRRSIVRVLPRVREVDAVDEDLE